MIIYKCGTRKTNEMMKKTKKKTMKMQKAMMMMKVWTKALELDVMVVRRGGQYTSSICSKI